MNRKQEIIASMPSCSQKEYYRNDLFREINGLQKEAVRIAFNDQHEEGGNYKIWDVLKQFEAENNDLGGVVTAQIETVKQQVQEMSDCLRELKGGRHGEQIVQEEIALFQYEYRNMTNIELKYGDEKCEIDDIVITPHGITLVEVKGYTKDVSIDRLGYIITKGRYINRRENIVEKMKTRERMVRTILQSFGINNIPIQSVLVFTEGNQFCNYSDIQVCVPTLLTEYIERQKSDVEVPILKVPGMIEKYQTHSKFPLGFDADAFKDAFANLVVALEEAEKERNDVLIAGSEDFDESMPITDNQPVSVNVPQPKPWWQKPVTWVVGGATLTGAVTGCVILFKKVIRSK